MADATPVREPVPPAEFCNIVVDLRAGLPVGFERYVASAVGKLHAKVRADGVLTRKTGLGFQHANLGNERE